jgi:biotin carboxyl carrier protein
MKYTAMVDDRSFPVLVEEREGLFTVEIDGRKRSLDLKSSPGSPLHSVILDGKQYEVVIEKGENGLSVYIDGETHSVQVLEEMKGKIRKVRKAEIEIKAAMPGLVVALEVKPGEKVEKDDGLLILEAMKMQNEVRSPHRGVIAAIHVAKGSAVEKGEKLVTLKTR